MIVASAPVAGGQRDEHRSGVAVGGHHDGLRVLGAGQAEDVGAVGVAADGHQAGGAGLGEQGLVGVDDDDVRGRDPSPSMAATAVRPWCRSR